MPYFVKENLKYVDHTIQKVKAKRYTKVAPLAIEAYRTKEPVPYAERTSGEKLSLKVGDSWGELFDCAWFHFTGEIPQAVLNAEQTPVLVLDVNGEMCIFDEDGCPVRGLTNVSSTFERDLGEPGKNVYELPAEMLKGGKVDVWADAGNNGLFGDYCETGAIKDADIALRDERFHKLYYDFVVLRELCENVDPDSARAAQIVTALCKASDKLITYSAQEVEEAEAILAQQLDKKNGDETFSISAIGHAHIDLAWLWPLRETVRKGARTFSTALANMEKYPDYVFGASQPQLYDWMKKYYPALYEKIKKAVDSGRWEAQGAMWVEPDTNVAGGEALARQLLYGKRFFQKEFGKDMQVLWLPDVFGYSGALPQLLRKAGVPYFMTQKLSWNVFNKHPHHTFLWKGIDGSEVLTHMLPEETYNSPGSPRAIRKAERDFLDKAVCDEAMLLFGIGDGGGGPGEEHLEAMAREKNLNGIARVKQEPSINFFKRQEKFRDDLVSFSGELYLERHQGTYTTQARNKRYNRLMEMALRELELSWSMLLARGKDCYEQQALEEVWKEVLLYQFHDILPGSSIDRVYEESLARYAALYEKMQDWQSKAYAALADQEQAQDNYVMNTLSWERTEWVQINGTWMQVQAKPLCFTKAQPAQAPDVVRASETTLENDKLCVTFNAQGFVEQVYDKENQRNVLNGVGNELRIYQDDGDCWDIEMMYNRKYQTAAQQSVKAYSDGVQGVVERVYCYGDSTITQKAVLKAGSRRLDFVTEVDWKEDNRMLRTSFPIDVYATEATCDIQFGNIKRPLHKNTTWDLAKYEVCAQKWVDVSQRDYGAAVMSDCKYGYALYDTTIDLDLLRSPSYPGRSADRAHHVFTYALYAHEGDCVQGKVAQAGYELAQPLKAVQGDFSQGGVPFVSVSAGNVIVESVKKAEDSDDIILRLYECTGASAQAKIELGFDAKEIAIADLMEQPQETVQDGVVNFRPFEIVTLICKR